MRIIDFFKKCISSNSKNTQKVSDENYMTPAEKFNYLAKKIYLILKPLNYRKEASNFRLIQNGDLGKVINLQKSLYNDKDSCSFTFNIGYYVETGKIENKRFKEYECIVRIRPACISDKYKKDTWWEITDNTDMEALYKELEAFIYSDIIPFLDYCQSRDDLIRKIMDDSFIKELKCAYYNISINVLKEIGYVQEGEKLLMKRK